MNIFMGSTITVENLTPSIDDKNISLNPNYLHTVDSVSECGTIIYISGHRFKITDDFKVFISRNEKTISILTLINVLILTANISLFFLK